MLDMKTQFGTMVLTDDGKAFADEALKKEIQNNAEGDIVPEIASINDIQIPKEDE